MVEFVAFGIIVDDIVFPAGETRMGVLGGGGPQTAWGMAAAHERPGAVGTVGLVAGIGDDLDREVLAPLRTAGIDLAGVRVTDQPTPRAWQVLEFDGRRTQVWRVPPATLGVQLARNYDVLPDEYRAARVFHWGIHPDDPRSLAFAQDLRAEGKRVSLEPFKPPDDPMTDDAIRAMLDACDIFSPNWREAMRITRTDNYPDMLARWRLLGARIVALRRGADGADVWDFRADNGEPARGVRVPAVPTSVIDVVGAGNAFCGAFAARLDDGLTDGLTEAACHASVAASYLVEQVGMPAALPDPADYARRLAAVTAGSRTLRA